MTRFSRFRSVLLFLFLIVGLSGSVRAGTIVVPAGGDFQAALNAANFGDTIILQAGASYQTQFGFVLPNKGPGTGTDADYITIQTSNLAGLAAANVRLNPPVHSPALARLVGTSQYAVIDTAVGAHHYKLIGLEITTNGAAYTPDLVGLGGDANRVQRNAMKGFVIDRCFIHPAAIIATHMPPCTAKPTARSGSAATAAALWGMNS